jgi:hypothetical protein
MLRRCSAASGPAEQEGRGGPAGPDASDAGRDEAERWESPSGQAIAGRRRCRGPAQPGSGGSQRAGRGDAAHGVGPCPLTVSQAMPSRRIAWCGRWLSKTLRTSGGGILQTARQQPAGSLWQSCGMYRPGTWSVGRCGAPWTPPECSWRSRWRGDAGGLGQVCCIRRLAAVHMPGTTPNGCWPSTAAVGGCVGRASAETMRWENGSGAV